MEKTKSGDRVGLKRVEKLFRDAESLHPEAAERFIGLEMKRTTGKRLSPMELRQIEVHEKSVRLHLQLRNWLESKKNQSLLEDKRR